MTDIRERFEKRFTPPDDAWFCEESESYKWDGHDVTHPFDEVWEGYQAATEDMQKDGKFVSYMLETIEAARDMNSAWIEALSNAKVAKMQGEIDRLKDALAKVKAKAGENCENLDVQLCDVWTMADKALGND